MTIERRRSARKVRIEISGLELRLYIVALLAAVYMISWDAIDRDVVAVHAPAPATAEPQRFVWIDQLPPDMRPAVPLPVGWRLASEPQASSPPPARVVHAPTRSPIRVRTRSS